VEVEVEGEGRGKRLSCSNQVVEEEEEGGQVEGDGAVYLRRCRNGFLAAPTHRPRECHSGVSCLFQRL